MIIMKTTQKENIVLILFSANHKQRRLKKIQHLENLSMQAQQNGILGFFRRRHHHHHRRRHQTEKLASPTAAP